MDSAEIASSDPRVRAILTEPDAYFTAALRRAWPQAGADIQAALTRRARIRRARTRGDTRAARFLSGLRRAVPALAKQLTTPVRPRSDHRGRLPPQNGRVTVRDPRQGT